MCGRKADMDAEMGQGYKIIFFLTFVCLYIPALKKKTVM